MQCLDQRMSRFLEQLSLVSGASDLEEEGGQISREWAELPVSQQPGRDVQYCG